MQKRSVSSDLFLALQGMGESGTETTVGDNHCYRYPIPCSLRTTSKLFQGYPHRFNDQYKNMDRLRLGVFALVGASGFGVKVRCLG